MEDFVFYRDAKITVWTREKYFIEAESIEDARRILKKKHDAVDLHVDDFEYLYETEEQMGEDEWIDEKGDTFSIED